MKPILFNTEMVRAILDGRKTVTRRAVKPQPDECLAAGENALELLSAACAPYRPGDVLYVRETWAKIDDDYVFKADDEVPEGWHLTAWRPSVHMPREAARIFLRVTDVRVERLQEITELDILEKEGLTVDFPQPKPSYMSFAYTEMRLKPAVRKAFSDLWDSTIKPADRALYGWEANPWCWVIEFERISKEEAQNDTE